MLWNGKSISDKGTLVQLKAMFNHRSASKNIFGSFNHIEELIRFSTEAHIIYLVLKICNMKFDGRPAHEVEGSDPHDSKDSRRIYLRAISRQVYEIIRLLPSQEEVNKVLEADINPDEWCWCSDGRYTYF